MLPFETGHYLRNLKSKASYQNAKFFATKGSVLIINTAKKELNTNKWKKLISIVMVETIREGRDFKPSISDFTSVHVVHPPSCF